MRISRADHVDVSWVLNSQGRSPRSSSVAWPQKTGKSPVAKTPRNFFHRYSSRKSLRSDRNCWSVYKEKSCRWSDIRSEMRLLKLQDNIPTRVWKSRDIEGAKDWPRLEANHWDSQGRIGKSYFKSSLRRANRKIPGNEKAPSASSRPPRASSKSSMRIRS